MAGRITVSTINDDTGVLAAQNGMRGIAKAWVNFVGTSGTINGSFNVSSITRNTTGDYTINFTTAMPNANYSITGFAQGGGSGVNTPGVCGKAAGTYSASAVQILAFNTATGAGADQPIVNCAVFSS